jgi:endonuclease/exonuclease/phosphatase family metal-dependent hydrolase
MTFFLRPEPRSQPRPANPPGHCGQGHLRRRGRRVKLIPVARKSQTLVVSVVVAILFISASALVLRGRLRCAGFAGPEVSVADLPPSAADNVLRVVSWNLRNFPLDERPQDADLGYSRRTNICDLEAVLAGLDGDLLGLQEINDTRRFPPILRRAVGDRPMGVRFSTGGGRFGQHLAIAWDTRALELVDEPFDIDDVVFEPGMRPSFAARFRSRRNPDLDFTFVVVHWESGRGGFADRRRQNRALAAWVDSWVARVGDPDVIAVGDFNTAGSPRGGTDGELQSIDTILGDAGLERLPNTTGCSQYWEGGGDPDGIQKSSLLDHVFLRGLGVDDLAAPVQAWLHCARFGCADLISRPGEEDGTFWDVSDHCPLTFEIRDADLKGQNEE